MRKFIKHDQNLQARIEETLQQMEIDLFAVNLATHQLKGEFDGLRACSCGYDCRIIFSIEKDDETGEEIVVILSHIPHPKMLQREITEMKIKGSIKTNR
ncbi:hypothetical protein BMF77_01217 [Dolichospermum sp. UHCC 0315A]|nr:hypothetical protein BMF77_01217 [Dolichospermum sp. UHCC 0315A]